MAEQDRPPRWARIDPKADGSVDLYYGQEEGKTFASNPDIGDMLWHERIKRGAVLTLALLGTATVITEISKYVPLIAPDRLPLTSWPPLDLLARAAESPAGIAVAVGALTYYLMASRNRSLIRSETIAPVYRNIPPEIHGPR